VSVVAIHYLRPPDRASVFHNVLVHRADDCIVTLMENTQLTRAVRVGGQTILEDGSPAVWLTFPDAWHDVGLFHTADDRFTGYYANILTPVVFRSETEWETTDLFLDVWLGADGAVTLLDEDELDAALASGWITEADAGTARAEALRLLNAAHAGTWPPDRVKEWTLGRARAVAAAGTSGDTAV
jgi:predicted RNA-binding protein associated with RNAse of E/G family